MLVQSLAGRIKDITIEYQVTSYKLPVANRKRQSGPAVYNL